MQRGKSRILSALTSALLSVVLFSTLSPSVYAQTNAAVSTCSFLNSSVCSSLSVSCSPLSLINEELFNSKQPLPQHASSGVYDYNSLLPTPSPTKTEAPSTTPQPTQVPTSPPSGTSLNAETVFNLINEHRKSIGLAPFEKNDQLCQMAALRGPEMADEVATGALHRGLYNKNYPYWITENMKYGGDENEVLRWWLNSPVHRAAIEGNYKYSCGVCVNDMCEQLFTNFTPK